MKLEVLHPQAVSTVQRGLAVADFIVVGRGAYLWFDPVGYLVRRRLELAYEPILPRGHLVSCGPRCTPSAVLPDSARLDERLGRRHFLDPGSERIARGGHGRACHVVDEFDCDTSGNGTGGCAIGVTADCGAL